jgi:hypothetical protein
VSGRAFRQGRGVTEIGCIRGRQLGAADLELIRAWLAEQPTWSRWRLSRELATRWDWRTPTGQLKDMAARDLLNRLAARGLIVLPARQRSGGRQRPRATLAATQPIQPALPGLAGLAGRSASPPGGPVALTELLPLSWHLARSGEPQRAHVARLLHEHHYLGYPDPLGQFHYLVSDRHGRAVACLLFGPAAWQVAARDTFVGWSPAQRQRGLGQLANNSRFLILPGVQTPQLASHLLATAVRRLRTDWQTQHGRPLWLVETFVERARFAGTCYRAANWQCVGQTTGRTRNDRDHTRRVPVKDVFLLPLVSDWRSRCRAL